MKGARELPIEGAAEYLPKSLTEVTIFLPERQLRGLKHVLDPRFVLLTYGVAVAHKPTPTRPG